MRIRIQLPKMMRIHADPQHRWKLLVLCVRIHADPQHRWKLLVLCVQAEEIADLMLKLQNETKCHNINFVTPEHVVPQVLSWVLKGLCHEKLQKETKCHNINFVTPEHVVPQVQSWVLKGLQHETKCHNINFFTPEHVVPQVGTELSIKGTVSWEAAERDNINFVTPEHVVPQVGRWVLSWVLKRLVNYQLCHSRTRCSQVLIWVLKGLYHEKVQNEIKFQNVNDHSKTLCFFLFKGRGGYLLCSGGRTLPAYCVQHLQLRFLALSRTLRYGTIASSRFGCRTL